MQTLVGGLLAVLVIMCSRLGVRGLDLAPGTEALENVKVVGT